MSENISVGDAGEVEYKVKVKHFKKKMNSWKPGKSIRNLKFNYKDYEFQMCIYPNGNTEDAKGFVSVFLQNNNNLKVCINCLCQSHGTSVPGATNLTMYLYLGEQRTRQG